MTGRLFELASEAARPPVRLVKMIGDAAMFASRDSVPLMDAVVDLVDAAGDEEIPPLKAGVARGPALGRGGDWYGRPVNLAARITSFARPDSVVVDQLMKDSLESADGRPLRASPSRASGASRESRARCRCTGSAAIRSRVNPRRNRSA